MKIKNLKNILCSSFLILLFIGNIAFGDNGCTNGMAGGRDDTPLYSCVGTNLPYNNSRTLEEIANANVNARIFLKMTNLDTSRIPCTNENKSQSENIVRGIQRYMQGIGDSCSTCEDGKLGEYTLGSMANCPAIICGNADAVPSRSGNELKCEDGYRLNDNKCCEEKPYEAKTPTITNTNPDWNNGVAHIVIQYTDDQDKVDHWDNNTPEINISHGTIDETTLNINQGEMRINFAIVNITDDTDSITVSVAEGLIIFTGNVHSLGGSQTLNREPQCQNPPISGTQDCSNQFGGRGEYSGTINCCIDSNECPNPPISPGQCSGTLVLDSAGQCCITCEHPINSSGNCTETGFTAQGNCCFADNMCGSGINVGGQCQPCEEGTIANEPHTKCICNSDLKCCGIQLNTVVPFIGDCIELNTDSHRGDTTVVTSVTAFPILMQGLMKILMSAIMVFSFLMVIVAGLMMTTGAFSNSSFSKGKTILKNVIISLILLGCSGLILSLINPSFFGG